MFDAYSLFSAFKKFSHNSPLYWAIPVAIIIFMLKSSKKRRIYTAAILFLLVIMLYNPVSYALLTSVIDASAYRIFWLIPAWAAFSYIIVSILEYIPAKKVRTVLAVLFSVLLMAFCIRTREYSYTTSNPYQIPKDTIELADKMLEIMDERGMDFAVLYGNRDFLATLRQYSSRFILHLEPRDHSDMEKNAGKPNYLGLGQDITTGEKHLNNDYLEELIVDNEIYFIVIYRDLSASIKRLKHLGWEELTGNDTFVVLCQDQWDDSYDE